ncbi:MAG: formate dehydrogenase accessory sulfurtransferase FdhD [Alphaproteobacteria bacterium]|nr:formate dehydrogenase accessory sulfurtransferase FdhD [Alphaproteobacteria bacterium]
MRSAVRVRRRLISRERAEAGERSIPEETPIAFTYDRQTYAVMMASPADLEDFAYGFSFTEGLITKTGDITDLEILELDKGIELRMTLAEERNEKLQSRARRFAGPAGCGLCGIESLEEAVAPPPTVGSMLKVDSGTVFRAMAELRRHQPVNAETRGVHAAGFWSAKKQSFSAVREDVGRHNALDKLAGALLRANADAAEGFLALTSRVSIELVQKAAVLGCPMLVAISVPTALALKTADAAGFTLAAIARDDSFEVFTHSERIEVSAHALV